MNWLYLPDSKSYLNMTYVQEVRQNTVRPSALVVAFSNDMRVDLYMENDVAKVREYLDRIAYC